MLEVWKTPAMIAQAAREVPLQRLGRPESRVGGRLRRIGSGELHDGETLYVSGGPAWPTARTPNESRIRISLSPGHPALLQEKDTRRFIDLAKMADGYGAEAVATHDTAFIGGDAYVRATLIALGAARARVGLRPPTRSPASPR